MSRKFDDFEPWEQVVAGATPCDHIVQLYQDQDFLNRAVCRFAGAALVNGEGVILVPTLDHWNAIRPRLEAEAVDVDAAQRRGQLTIVDANGFLPQFMQGAKLDSTFFLAWLVTSLGMRALAAGIRKSAGGARW